MTTETILAICAVVTLFAVIAAALVTDGRSRARNETTADRVTKLEGLERVAFDNKGRIDALERRVDDNHTQLDRRLEKIEALLEGIRGDLHRRRDDTNPGR